MPRIELPRLRPDQAAIRLHTARFKVVACGRRWGKTTLGMVAVVEEILQGQHVWWVAPTYPTGLELWTTLKQTLNPIVTEKSEQYRRLAIRGGGVVRVVSADSADNLRGVGLDFMVIDEAAFVPVDVWQAVLRPTLSDTGGGALIISTSNGHNWFQRGYQQGQDTLAHPTWASWQAPSSDNPLITAEEIDEARSQLPADIFRQEYLAEFIRDAGAVFRNIRACVGSQELSGRYAVGIDWAQSKDFTVITVIDTQTGAVVDIDRFNQIDYDTQIARLQAVWDTWGVRYGLSEANAMGTPILERIQMRGMSVEGFWTSNETKARIIQQLQVAFERGEITIPDNPTLIAELQAYEIKRLPSGRFRYEAPAGMHDDMVMSLALAWEAVLLSQPLMVEME